MSNEGKAACQWDEVEETRSESFIEMQIFNTSLVWWNMIFKDYLLFRLHIILTSISEIFNKYIFYSILGVRKPFIRSRNNNDY